MLDHSFYSNVPLVRGKFQPGQHVELDAVEYSKLSFACFRLAQGNRTLHEQLICGVIAEFPSIRLAGLHHLRASWKLICDFMETHLSSVSHEAHSELSNRRVKSECYWAFEKFLTFQQNARFGNLDPEYLADKIIDSMIERDVHYLIRNPNRPVSLKEDSNQKASESLIRYRNSSFIVSYCGIGRSTGSELVDWAINRAMEIFVDAVDVEQRAKIQVVANRHFEFHMLDKDLVKDRYKDLLDAN